MTSSDTRDLYLDLLEKTLSFSLWDPPPVPIIAENRRRSRLKGMIVRAISDILSMRQLQLVHTIGPSREEADEGLIWPAYAHTMIGRKRLGNLRYCVEVVIKDHVPGDLIETGVWRGGACILMRGVLKAYGIEDRRVFVADSFAGLPKPDTKTYEADKDDRHYLMDYLAVPEEAVKENFRRYGLLDDQVVFLKGWFKDTLPEAPIHRLAVMRLDGDMYGSTMDALTSLYPKLSVGGFCIIDDYALPGCRQAVDDFRANGSINENMITVDQSGVYWRKERDASA